jgi:excisionase family DNA binding protein
MSGAVQIRSRLLPMKKAAEYLDMHPWTVRQLVQRGELGYISAGDNTSAWRFDVLELDRWIEAHRIGPK